MSKLLTIPRFWGPLGTIVFVVVYHAGSVYFGYTISLAWVWLPVIAAAFVGGFRAGLISAIFMCLYAFYAIPQLDRVVQVVITVPLVAGLVGWQTRLLRRALADAREWAERATAALERAEINEAAAQALGALNGNILRIRHSRNLLLKTLEQQRLDEMAREEIRQVLHVLNNLEQATAGWQELAKIKGWIDEEDK